MLAYVLGLGRGHRVPGRPKPDFRYVPRKRGRNPVVVVAMNSSHVSDAVSDETINMVFEASNTLRYDGWTVLSLYPERSPAPARVGRFDPKLPPKLPTHTQVHETNALRKLGVRGETCRLPASPQLPTVWWRCLPENQSSVSRDRRNRPRYPTVLTYTSTYQDPPASLGRSAPSSTSPRYQPTIDSLT